MAGFLLLLWGPLSHSIPDSQLSVSISAESAAKVVIYYRGLPVSESGIDFDLLVDGRSNKLERTTSDLYLVGNVDRADIIFAETEFVLHQTSGGSTNMLLDGDFILGDTVANASRMLRMPVIRNIQQATSASRLKIKFSSKQRSGSYSSGDYSNVFTLIVTPVI